MAVQMYKYRLYPSAKQRVRLLTNFKICKEAYNTLLDMNKKILTTRKYDFNGLILDMKTAFPEYKQVHSQVLQNVSDRMSNAFDSFFRRVKQGDRKKGYPRFKSRINSITYPQSGFKIFSDKRLKLSKIGSVPIVLHRVPKGKIKTLTIKQNKAGQWFAVFSCELSEKKVRHENPDSKVGIDVGLENFATLSNGQVIANPRHILKAEKRLKLLQRRLSRKKKGSANRRKAVKRLAKGHLKVSNSRADFLHKLSHRITKTNAFISVEKLNIKGMVRNHHLAKHIHDASWNGFIQMLSYKAVRSGGELAEINPHNTSKTCNKCGTITEMPLSKRKFLCPKCGFSCHRDLNASHNISTVGLMGTLTPVDIEPLSSVFSKESLVVEAGTICDKA